MGPNGKSNASFTLFGTTAPTPEEGIPTTVFYEMIFVRKARFAEGCYVNVIASEFFTAVLLSGLSALVLSSRVRTFHVPRLNTFTCFVLGVVRPLHVTPTSRGFLATVK